MESIRSSSIAVNSIKLYRFLRLLGKGSFGRVALAMHKLSGREVAVKVFEKA